MTESYITWAVDYCVCENSEGEIVDLPQFELNKGVDGELLMILSETQKKKVWSIMFPPILRLHVVVFYSQINPSNFRSLQTQWHPFRHSLAAVIRGIRQWRAQVGSTDPTVVWRAPPKTSFTNLRPKENFSSRPHEAPSWPRAVDIDLIHSNFAEKWKEERDNKWED